MNIEAIGIQRYYTDVDALKNVDLTIQSGELLALLGPSGCGKTTLLRILAGLEFPDHGIVRFAGQDMTHIDARHRRVGFVFQHYALFNHLTVFENIAFGLRIRPRHLRPRRTDLQRRVNELLELIQLAELGQRYPMQLSGGQRQRVALARALAVEPAILLLDEPFGALDASVRGELRRWLRGLHDRIPITSVFVTHDQEEAFELADRVAVMNQGRIEQLADAESLYIWPVSPFVCRLLGEINELPSAFHAPWTGRHEAGIEAFVRPHDLEFVHARDEQLSVQISSIRDLGSLIRVEAVHASLTRPLVATYSREHFAAAPCVIGDKVVPAPRSWILFAGDKPV